MTELLLVADSCCLRRHSLVSIFYSTSGPSFRGLARITPLMTYYLVERILRFLTLRYSWSPLGCIDWIKKGFIACCYLKTRFVWLRADLCVSVIFCNYDLSNLGHSAGPGSPFYCSSMVFVPLRSSARRFCLTIRL